MSAEPSTQHADGSRRRPGRPRDATIDLRVLDATRRSLAADGFAGTTIQAIATTSGVPVSAIYRRWGSRIELIEDAVVFGPPTIDPPTGRLAADLARFDGALRVAVGRPEARSAVPALLSAYQSGDTGRPPEAWWRDSWRPAFYALLEAAGPEQVDPEVDADDAFDTLLGLAFVQTFVPTARERPDAPARTVEVLCRLLAPR